jgi:tmRNA-binding protein
MKHERNKEKNLLKVNKKVLFNYEIKAEKEAGIVLQG